MQHLDIEHNNIFVAEIGSRSRIYESIKRFFDIICSFCALVILMPIMLILALLIKLDSKGPVLFTQDRVGKNGKIFKMYKFRSMVNNADELKKKLIDKNERKDSPMFKMKNDPRVTSVGKFIRKTSIDELPQLVNILKGDMSIVGPRPSLINEVEQFSNWMLERLKVKPGLTCYWQVQGRDDVKFEEWMKLDIKYIQERNILIDIKLILKTFFVLCGDKNAS